MWQQLITPNLNTAYIGGLCQKANENSTGQNGIYPSAYRAWLSNVQHTELPPSGVYVPVYLSMPNGPKDSYGVQAGDVALSCPDGSIAAAALPGNHPSLYKYPTLQSYIADYSKNNGGATYLGWGEFIGKKQVVKQEGELTMSQVDDIYNAINEANKRADADRDNFSKLIDGLNKKVDSLFSIVNGTNTNVDQLKKDYATNDQHIADAFAALNSTDKRVDKLEKE